MADHFADAYWSTQFWSVRYFQGGEADPNAMSASLSGAGSVTANLTASTETVTVQGGGWLSKAQLREYEKNKRRKRIAIDALEETVEEAYSVLHGKEIPAKVIKTPAAVVSKARELSRAIVAKKAQADATAEELALLKELKRLADQVIADMKRREQEEEEAIVLLLAA